jgi:hypothetical protein
MARSPTCSLAYGHDEHTIIGVLLDTAQHHQTHSYGADIHSRDIAAGLTVCHSKPDKTLSNKPELLTFGSAVREMGGLICA